jgi:hypothetical protein
MRVAAAFRSYAPVSMVLLFAAFPGKVVSPVSVSNRPLSGAGLLRPEPLCHGVRIKAYPGANPKRWNAARLGKVAHSDGGQKQGQYISLGRAQVRCKCAGGLRERRRVSSQSSSLFDLLRHLPHWRFESTGIDYASAT